MSDIKCVSKKIEFCDSMNFCHDTCWTAVKTTFVVKDIEKKM